MSSSSSRLGALAEHWNVPSPDDLKARLQPEPEVEREFYKDGLLSAERRFPKAASFEVYQDDTGAFRWRLRTEEGDVLADSSRTYSSREACRRIIDQVRTLSLTASVKERS